MRSIRSQFTLIFCLLAILPLAVFGLFAYGTEAHHLRRDYEAKLLALHENKALLLESWLKERLGDARYAADSPLISGLLANPSPERLTSVRQRLALFARSAVAYERVFVVSAANGQVVASTRPPDEGRPPSRGLGGLLEGRQGSYVSDAFCSGEPCQPHIDLGVPVAPPGARPLGALLIEINLSEALSRTALSRRGLGETGEVVLVTPELLALTEPRYRPGGAFRLRVTSQPARLTQEGVSLIQSSDYRAVPVVATYSRIRRANWGLLVKQDEAELEQPITMLRWLLLAVVGGSVAVAAAAAAWLAGWLTRPLAALARAIRGLSQGERGVRVEARGPSELAGTARAFNAMARELQALEVFRERFAAAAGHDLKGNLVPLAGLLKLLASGRPGELTGKQRELLGACQRSAERQLSLIDRLIEAVRLHAGGVALEWRDVSVTEVLAENAALYRPLAEEAGVALQLEAPEDVVVRADRERLSSIIQNLLANAIRYNQRGGRVKMAACAHGGRVEIEVADTGRGIAPEEQPALFEPFSHLSSFKDGGLGLGLWIVKTLVELHGWTISMESQSGKGSSFRIMIAAPS